ncbi:MAG: slipin family protein [Pseudomonadota bacterium]
MMRILDRLIGIQRVTVPENQRALVLEKGRFRTILTPGRHILPARHVEIEWHDLAAVGFTSTYATALLSERPDLVAAHLTEVRTEAGEVALILRDGQPISLLQPLNVARLWTAVGPWEVQRVSIADSLALEPVMAARLARFGPHRWFTQHEVAEGAVGLLTVDGVASGTLGPGTHRFWNVSRKVEVRQIDTRWRAYDVSGQEILTKDRVTLRVNLGAEYRVTDPERAARAVRDFEEALHRALQFAFRRTLGALTLDQLLAEKVAVDAEAAERVRTEMAEIGLEVGAIALKDVILPGEMREILNRVVAAEKEAEASVIRRREETNATRALLNTAKVMAENPVMLRLKELEALETISARVGMLTVHNGADGLMTDLVKLRD